MSPLAVILTGCPNRIRIEESAGAVEVLSEAVARQVPGRRLAVVDAELVAECVVEVKSRRLGFA